MEAKIDYRFFFWAKRRKRKSLAKRNTPYLWALPTPAKGAFFKKPLWKPKNIGKRQKILFFCCFYCFLGVLCVFFFSLDLCEVNE